MTFAFLFPGQGSQSVGMMRKYHDTAIIRETFDQAAEALGFDLWHLVDEGPAAELDLTINTQPAMLVAGVACYRMWRHHGGQEPAMMAGHSLGEYTALVCADALDYAEAVKLVRLRGEAMQNAVPEGEGALAAILGMEDDAVRSLCAEAAEGQVLEAANFNSPGQVVIAGHKAAVERAMHLAKAHCAKRAMHLPVSVPSHCSLMRPAASKLVIALRDVEFRPPRIPVVHNADVACYADPDQIRDALARQLYSPVRWSESMRYMHARGINLMAECGPGRVLAGLNKRILHDMPTLALIDDAHLDEMLQRTGSN